MLRRLLIMSGFLAALTPLYAQKSDAPGNEEKGPYIGVLFTAVSDALYDQLPQLARKQGILVTHVLADSPAAKADLRRNDILLQFDDQKIRDCEHFANLIRNSKPKTKVTLRLMRGGKETSVEVVVELGLVLKIAEANTREGATDPPEIPKGTAKLGGPPPINLVATPLEQGRMRVSVEYLPEGGTRLRTVTCEGSEADVDAEINKQLPEKERALVHTALQRIRNLITDKPDSKRGPG